MLFRSLVNPVSVLHRWFHALCAGKQQHAWLPAAERMTASRSLAVFLPLAFFAASSAHVVHIGSLYIDVSREDEKFTLGEGLEYLNPFGKPDERFEVGETARWFVRLLYPTGLFYVNSHKGAAREEEGASPRLHKESVISEWKEGGRVHSNKYPSLVADNPVVQDYAFSMRAAFGVPAAAGFCLVL